MKKQYGGFLGYFAPMVKEMGGVLKGGSAKKKRKRRKML